MSADGASHNSAPPLSLSLNFRLSAMMFLQYAIWGAWLPILWPFLSGHRGLSGDQIGSIFAVGATGAIIGPFVAGQIADRWFSTEKFLAISHILGGLLVWQLCWIDDYQNFLIFSLLYSIIYLPTLSLTNSLAFHHLPDRDRDFSRVRIWGTIGWIVVGIAVGHWLLHEHTVYEEEATAQLIEQHIFDEAGRKQLSDRVELKFNDDTERKGETLTGILYDSLSGAEQVKNSPKDDRIVLNVGTEDRPVFETIPTAEVALKPMLEVLVREERLAEVKAAITQLDAGSADNATIRASLTAHSKFTFFRTLGGEPEFGTDTAVELESGDTVTGKLVGRSAKLLLLDVGKPKLRVIPRDSIAGSRKHDGEPVIGTLKSEEDDKLIVEKIDGTTAEIARADFSGQEHYGIFTDKTVQARRMAVENAGKADAFRLSAVLGVLLGLFCLVLPKTPPQPGKQKSATQEALGEIKRNPLLTLFLLAVPISCIHQFYFVHTAGFVGAYQSNATGMINKIFGVGGGGLMTIGQAFELVVLAMMPLLARKISRKNLLAIGIVAYGLRMFLFAYVDVIPLPEIVTLMVALALHGFCFGCFIFVAFMIVDEETTGDIRASAQSLFNLVIVGIGIIVGSLIAGRVADWATTDKVMDYQKLFSVPMWASVACLVALLVCYPGGRRKAT
jgi:MFS family permease